jgi:hypothetical protein
MTRSIGPPDTCHYWQTDALAVVQKHAGESARASNYAKELTKNKRSRAESYLSPTRLTSSAKRGSDWSDDKLTLRNGN